MGRQRLERPLSQQETERAAQAMLAARAACAAYFSESYGAHGHPPVDERGGLVADSGVQELDTVYLEMVRACDTAAKATNPHREVTEAEWVEVAKNATKALIRDGNITPHKEDDVDSLRLFSDQHRAGQVRDCLLVRALASPTSD